MRDPAHHWPALAAGGVEASRVLAASGCRAGTVSVMQTRASPCFSDYCASTSSAYQTHLRMRKQLRAGVARHVFGHHRSPAAHREHGAARPLGHRSSPRLPPAPSPSQTSTLKPYVKFTNSSFFKCHRIQFIAPLMQFFPIFGPQNTIFF